MIRDEFPDSAEYLNEYELAHAIKAALQVQGVSVGLAALLLALPSFLRDVLSQEHRGADPFAAVRPGDPAPFPADPDDPCGVVFFDAHGDEYVCSRPAHPARLQCVAIFDNRVVATSVFLSLGPVQGGSE